MLGGDFDVCGDIDVCGDVDDDGEGEISSNLRNIDLFIEVTLRSSEHSSFSSDSLLPPPSEDEDPSLKNPV